MNKLLEATKQYQTVERRVDTRHACEFPARLTILSLPSGQKPSHEEFRGMATNVSLSGTRVAITTYADLEIGTIVRIRLSCGILKSFTFVGTLRSVKKDVRDTVYFASFEITGSSAQTIKAWHKFIAKHQA